MSLTCPLRPVTAIAHPPKRGLCSWSVQRGELQRRQLPSPRLVKRRCAASDKPGLPTQTYSSGSLSVEMPLATVQQLPEPQQAAVVAAVFAALGSLTFLSCSVLAPALEAALPDFMAFSRSTWPLLGTTFVAAGYAHFALHDAFVTMMPRPGAWGFWNLPGSPSFHVNWTGVAELAGGAGVLLGAVPQIADAAPWLGPAAAAGLFALSVAVYPANVYMYTHNAPGPGPAGVPIPPAGHAARFLLQVFLLSTLWGLAHPV